MEGPQVEPPLGGAPPRPLGPPQWPPGVPEIWKKLQKFPKIILEFYMHQNTSNFNSNIHFGPLGPVGGALEGENLQEGVVGGFSEARALVLFLNVLNWSIKEVLGGGLMIF